MLYTASLHMRLLCLDRNVLGNRDLDSYMENMATNEAKFATYTQRRQETLPGILLL